MTEYTVTRKVHAQGGSLLIALPKAWARAQGLADGSTVEVVFDDIVKIFPKKADAT
jgi:antitoxin component of MazEF toxin-antitoxin module